MTNNFLQQAKDLFPYTQSLRRDFHMHPELGFNEIRTGGIVAKELEALGIEVTKGVGKTGPIKGEWEGRLTRFISRLEAKGGGVCGDIGA